MIPTHHDPIAPPSSARKTKRWVVTGSSGFIGSRLCHALARIEGNRPELFGVDKAAAAKPEGYTEILSDIRNRANLEPKLSALCPDVLIHLAAIAEAVIPFPRMTELVETNLTGTINLLDVVRTGRVLFASSSSVYGNTSRRGDTERWENINPLGAYAGTKALGELVLAAWTKATGGTAISLRLGNVVGPGCHGLIEYIIGHALTDPEGLVEAKLRGLGRITRDYVPLDYVVHAIERASDVPAAAGASIAYNVSAGVRLTNGFVADVVMAVLAKKGYVFKADFDTPRFAEEPVLAALDVESAAAALGLVPPGRDEVVEAIEAAVVHGLERRTTLS